jgi:diacylglycerol kinase (ATP)
VADLPFLSPDIPLLVFVNPLAGRGRAGAHLSRVREVFEAQKMRVDFVLTKSGGELEDRAAAAIADGRRMLLAMGGDGTFQGLANAAYGSGAVLGVLPAGGGNDFAAALGLPNDPVAAARAVLRGVPRAVDLARARTDDGRERLYTGGGGVGLDVDALQFAAGIYRGLPGRLRYVASALRAFQKFKPLQIHVEFWGGVERPMDGPALLASVLNTPTYGAGLCLAPEALMDDGRLDLAVLQDLSAWQVMGLLPGLLRSGKLPRAYIRQAVVQRVRLSADRPCFFHGDGEILGPAPVEIAVVPNAAQVLSMDCVGRSGTTGLSSMPRASS